MLKVFRQSYDREPSGVKHQPKMDCQLLGASLQNRKWVVIMVNITLLGFLDLKLTIMNKFCPRYVINFDFSDLRNVCSTPDVSTGAIGKASKRIKMILIIMVYRKILSLEFLQP